MDAVRDHILHFNSNPVDKFGDTCDSRLGAAMARPPVKWGAIGQAAQEKGEFALAPNRCHPGQRQVTAEIKAAG